MRTWQIVLSMVAVSGSIAAEPIPMEYFVKPPAYASPLISPDGTYLAISVDRGDSDVLAVLRVDDLSIVHVNELPDGKSIAGHRWISDKRLMFTALRKVGQFASPAPTGEWFAVDADGSNARPVIHYGTRAAAEATKRVGNRRFSFLDPLDGDDRSVLMAAALPRSMEGAITELVRVDSMTGKWRVLDKAPQENCTLALDEKLEARFAQCFKDENEAGEYDGISELLWRNGEDRWVKVPVSAPYAEYRVAAVAGDGTVYVEADDRKKPAHLGTLDPATGAFTKLVADEISDIATVIRSVDGKTPIAAVTAAGAPEVTMMNEDHPDAQLYLALSKSFPNQFVQFSNATADGQKLIFGVYSDRNPGELYLYDRKEGKARFLMANREALDPDRMATMLPLSFTSRDGLKIHAYLTVPNGKEPKNLPLIVNPHGGPMGPRDNWGFNWETQLLASRGFAVLQINFRGSGGFGKAFMDMAYGQWHTGIMHDIIDGTRYVIERGIANPNRICIYGGSFGGYSAMMAPAVDPELFRCAYGYVGMYDAQIQFKRSDTGNSNDGERYLDRAFGKTREEQIAMSPITYADQLKLPIALAAGARDPRCPPEHTEAMAKALTKAGNPPEHVIIESGEQHGFYKPENRVKLYTAMLAFFDKHIGPNVKDKVEVGPAVTQPSGP